MYERISSEKLMIYGAGSRGKKIGELLISVGVDIRCFVDKNADRVEECCGCPVINLSDMCNFKKDYWTIAIADKHTKDKIENFLLDNGLVSRERRLDYNELMIFAFSKLFRNNSKKVTESRIIFGCANGLGLGGIETWSMNICSHLKNGLNVRLLTNQNLSFVRNDIRQCVDSVLDFEQFSVVTNAENLINYFEQCNNIVVTSQVDFVFLCSCGIKKAGGSIKIVSVVHGGTDEIYQCYAKYLEYVDLFIAVSNDIKVGLIHEGVPHDRVIAVTLPVKVKKDLVREYTLDASEPLKIGYAGRLETEQKRVELIKLLTEELESKNCNYILEIAGEGSYKKQLMEDMASNPRVKLVGRLNDDEIQQFWIRQDIAISVSDYEGHSISQMEAMANGVVPIVTNVSGVKEDISYGKNGFFVDKSDYKEMSKIIAMLDKNRDYLSKLGENAYKVITAKCNEEEHIEFWKRIFNSFQENNKWMQ